MLTVSLLLSSLLAKGLVANHPTCTMSPLNKNYSVCVISSASSDGEKVNGTDASIGTVYFVDKSGKMYLAEPGRYVADKAVAGDVKNPFIVQKDGDYREYIGASELNDGTKVEFYYFDALGHTCDIYKISADGKFTELKDGEYTLKNGQTFRVEGEVVQDGVFDPETNKIVDPLANEQAGGK